MKAEDLYQAMAEVKPEYLEESESQIQKRSCKVILRSALIAAVIAAAGCMTALAVTFSLRDSARMDMGISKEAPIPEWTEYEDIGTADTGPEAAEGMPAQAVLTATLCAGDRLCTYVEVSPVDPEVAMVLADNADWHYEWNMQWRGPYGCTGDAEQVDYDVETQTALVKVTLTGDGLEQEEQVEVRLYLDHELKAEAAYGPVVIPITQAGMLSCPADLTVQNVKAHLIETNPAILSEVEIPDYVSEGRITQVAICAGYLEVELETPSLDQWLPLTDLEQVEIEQSDFPDQIDLKKMFLQSRFCGSWSVSVHETLAGATLNYKDGTSQVIDEIPSAYAGVWLEESGPVKASVYEGERTYQFIPRQAFDLSRIKSITMGGTEYFFPTGD